MDTPPPIFPPKDPDSRESELPPTWKPLEPEPEYDINFNLHEYDPLQR